MNANPGYVSVAGQETKVTPIDFANALKRLYPNQVDLQTAIYTISYIRTYQSNSNTNAGSFNGWNNNLGTLSTLITKSLSSLITVAVFEVKSSVGRLALYPSL